MEAAKCRLCGERHYGLCKQFQEEVQKPLKKIKEIAVSRLHEKDLTGHILTDDLAGFKHLKLPCQCSCCVLRREKVLAAVKKHREKKKRGQAHGE